MKRVCALAIIASAALLRAQGGPPATIEWPVVGGDQARTHYSAAADVTSTNVNQLDLVWRWDPAEQVRDDGTRPEQFQGTPLMIDNVLYLPTSLQRLVALDAETGGQLWAFDPRAYEDGPGINHYYKHRGVASRREGNDLRIFMNSHPVRGIDRVS